MKIFNIIRAALVLVISAGAIDCQAQDTQHLANRLASCSTITTWINNILSNPAYFVPNQNAYVIQFQTTEFVQAASCSQVLFEIKQNASYPSFPGSIALTDNQLSAINACSSVYDWLNPYSQGDVYFPTLTTGNLKDELWKGKYLNFTDEKISQFNTCKDRLGEISAIFNNNTDDSALRNEIANLQQTVTDLINQNLSLIQQVQSSNEQVQSLNQQIQSLRQQMQILNSNLAAANKTIMNQNYTIQQQAGQLTYDAFMISQLKQEITRLKTQQYYGYKY